ncbi:MAG: hypothetical protein ABI614_02480, partial [Planctomycetota bacterium]
MLLETLEPRQLLAIGPQLIGIQPNNDALLSFNKVDVRSVGPQELVFKFDENQTFDVNALRNNPGLIQITRSNKDEVPQGSDPQAAFAAATAVSTFDDGMGNVASVRFTAVRLGEDQNGITISYTKSNQGSPGPPSVTVTGRQIAATLNTNPGISTTALDLVNAINRNPNARELVIAELVEDQVGDKHPDVDITKGNVNIPPAVLQGANDIVIRPGFIGPGASPNENELIFRFSEPLPDDLYRIDVFGSQRLIADNDGDGNPDVSRHPNLALRNMDASCTFSEAGQIFVGCSFGDSTDDTVDDGFDRTAVYFELDLGAQIIAVVPQPVTRNASGGLTQATNQIVVYFNDDDLANSIITTNPSGSNPTVVDRSFYQLIATKGTVENTDDSAPILPTTITYNPTTDTAVLTFAQSLNLLGAGNETFRLRIGTDESQPLFPISTNVLLDAGSSFGTAMPIEPLLPVGVNLAMQGLIIASDIQPQPFPLDFPGSNDEPGHRDLSAPGDKHIADDSADSQQGIRTIQYNFRPDFGFVADAQGNQQPVFNLITERQKERAREALELLERAAGVQFVETVDKGLIIATGDLRAIDTNVFGAADYRALSNPATAIDQRAFGFVDFLPGGAPASNGGSAIGRIGKSDVLRGPGVELQDAVILGGANPWNDTYGRNDDLTKNSWFETAIALVGNYLGLGTANDLPALSIAGGDPALNFGNTLEPIYPGDQDIVHLQHLYRPDSIDIDLYRVTIPAGANGQFTAETMAERLTNASLLDTHLQLYRENADGTRELLAQNDDYFSDDSYIELTLEPGVYYVGVSASGNKDYDPIIQNTGFGGTTQGHYELRLNFRPNANRSIVDVDNALTPAAGTPLDGDADGTPGGVYDFWFKTAGAANTIFVDKFPTPSGGLVGSITNPYSNLKNAFAAARPGDIVRIVGNPGEDGDLATLTDNRAYQIGFNSLGTALPDGVTLEVPKGVTAMVDAGAIFQLRRARIGVGSNLPGIDRSQSSLQVLGTPSQSVYFTSFEDQTIGLDTFPFVTTPRPGDWGGIVFRADVDRLAGNVVLDEEGIFLNYVNHADIRYGGGSVIIGSVPQVIDPIHITSTQPTITFNTITASADAAISADTNAFEEINFHAPRHQKIPFTSDYRRIGPDIHGNELVRESAAGLVSNTLNGLFVRTATTAGGTADTLIRSARWDDTDIVHIVKENLAIQGTPGGPLEELIGPPVGLITLVRPAAGSIPAGTYHYRISNVDRSGYEGPLSDATRNITVGANSSIALGQLPTIPANSDFVARRVYRSGPGGNGPYTLVAQLNGLDTNYTDAGTINRGTLLSPSVAATTLTPRSQGGLTGGTYNYKIAFVNSFGQELTPSSATASVTISGDPDVNGFLGNGTIELNAIPVPDPTTFGNVIAKRVYRSTVIGAGPYELISQLAVNATSYMDFGPVAQPTLLSPSVANVVLTPVAAGMLMPGTYNYFVAFVNAAGQELAASSVTASLTVSGNPDVLTFPGNGSIMLDNLPVAAASLGTGVTTRIYRSTSTGTGPYELVTAVPAGTQSVVDTGTAGQGTLLTPPVAATTVTAAGNGNLTAGTYNYRVVYVNAAGQELAASAPTMSATISGNPQANGMPGNGTLVINNLPLPTPQFGDDNDVLVAKIISKRIYRSDATGAGIYELVGQVDRAATTFTDSGIALNSRLTGQYRPRQHARLSVDPSVIVKFDGARIQTGVDAQLIAEGREGLNVVMTSVEDDRYGAGGTFDTSNDGVTSGAAGEWAGLYIGQSGRASFDHVLFAYGGGVSRIEGTINGFNVLEIHQADVRVANSVFEFNAAGQGGQGQVTTPNRFGRGFNEPATIFVRGAQPIIIDNVIRANAGPAISINVNSLNHVLQSDSGRSTGLADRLAGYRDNQGPLIVGNLLGDNGTNGMVIRAQTLTTQSVWDDTSIVHVLPANEIVHVPDFHTYGGLRLKSNPTESLVVKFGAGAGLTADGRPLEIDDRIGGILQIIGQPGSPVVLTSLADDTAGAGNRPNGDPQTDTNGDGSASQPQPGDWRSILLDRFSHDRNVEVITEGEPRDVDSPGVNSNPDDAQLLGDLATGEKSSDENLRLGFEVLGFLNDADDVDVYSFSAVAGTEIWLDVDRTTQSLDTVVEVIDGNGVLVARSINSLLESNNANNVLAPEHRTLANLSPAELDDPYLLDSFGRLTQKTPPFGGVDHWSVNPRDAAMRLILPGPLGVRGTYHVRLRSNNFDIPNPAQPNLTSGDFGPAGLTSGAYQMQIRLREIDEIAGSTVRFADIRYAQNGIEVLGQPTHSPLTGEAGEIENATNPNSNNSQGNAQNVGNLVNSDRGVISIAGRLETAGDVDLYQFNVNFSNVAVTPRTFEAIFDIDYADGAGRANTNLYVFNAAGALVLAATDSNIAEDRRGPLGDANVSDLSRGTVGSEDPYIGTVELSEGTYFVAVTSNARVPTDLAQFLLQNPPNPLARLEPVHSVDRIVEDHIGSNGGSTGQPASELTDLLDNNSIIPFHLGDVTLFVSQQFDTLPPGPEVPGNPPDTRLLTVDPFTGAIETVVNRFGLGSLSSFGADIGDIALNQFGDLYSYTTASDNRTICEPS